MVAHDGQVAVEVRHGNAADHHERHPGRACEPGRGLPGPPRRTVTAATAGDQPILEEDGMRYGVLGTGMVGRALASALVADGAEVRMGARQQGNEMALDWAPRRPPAGATGPIPAAPAVTRGRVPAAPQPDLPAMGGTGHNPGSCDPSVGA